MDKWTNGQILIISLKISQFSHVKDRSSGSWTLPNAVNVIIRLDYPLVLPEFEYVDTETRPGGPVEILNVSVLLL
jgi:hypothetical protein